MTGHRFDPGPVLLLVLSLLAGASPAHAQMEREQHLRLSANLGLGFAGEYDLSADSDLGSIETENDLDPTVGFGFRVEQPLLDFLSIGGMFETLSYEPDVSGADREWLFNFDVLVRVRHLIEVVRGELFLEPYGALPVGFSFAVLDDPDGTDPDGDEAWPGWNVGAMAGLAVITSARFGGFVELGWRHAEVYTNVDGVIDTEFAVTVNELAMNLGASFLLE